MTRKDDLLETAAELGIEGLDDSFTNVKIQELIDLAQAAGAGPDDPAAVEEAPVASAEEESVFTLAQLQPYSEQLFGVGGQVLVGAVSAGCIPSGSFTKSQAQAGIDQYLKMPVEKGKEG